MKQEILDLRNAYDDKKGQAELDRVFNAVAPVITQDFPDLWGESLQIWNDSYLALLFLCKPDKHFSNRMLIEVAAESQDGREQVLAYLGRINHYGYP